VPARLKVAGDHEDPIAGGGHQRDDMLQVQPDRHLEEPNLARCARVRVRRALLQQRGIEPHLSREGRVHIAAGRVGVVLRVQAPRELDPLGFEADPQLVSFPDGVTVVQRVPARTP